MNLPVVVDDGRIFLVINTGFMVVVGGILLRVVLTFETWLVFRLDPVIGREATSVVEYGYVVTFASEVVCCPDELEGYLKIDTVEGVVCVVEAISVNC